MATRTNPQNQKQRRAAAAAAASTARTELNDAFDSSSLPLARPPSSSIAEPTLPKAKTLYELAAERQAQLSGGQPFLGRGGGSGRGRVDKSDNDDDDDDQRLSRATTTKLVKIGADGTLTLSPTEVRKAEQGQAEGERQDKREGERQAAATTEEDMMDGGDSNTLPVLLDTMFLSLSLSMIHFTLSFLAAHQYAQRIDVRSLFASSAFVAFPALSFVVHLMHGHVVDVGVLSAALGRKTSTLLLQGFYLCVALLAGCRLIEVTNEMGYYAVMKRAPSIGTIWVWSVLEMGLMGAVLGLLGPAAYAWWWGYGIF